MASNNNGQDFLANAKALGTVDRVDVPGLAMDVFVRPLSAPEIKAISDKCVKESDEDGFDEDKLVLYITAAAVVDKKKNRLVPEGSEDELAALPSAVYMPLVKASLKINGLNEASGN